MNSKFRRWALAIALGLMCIGSYAQTGGSGGGIPIAGTVTDSSGDPLPGVNVVIKGTSTGVVTGGDGKYAIIVPNRDAVLQFSFVGYATQEIPVGNRTDVSATMAENVSELDEVVVVGYGSQKKVNLTGAVSSISSEKLTVAPIASTTNALAGRLPA